MLWEAIFLLLILKIPIVYLGYVVWWAVKSKPEPPLPPEPALKIVGLDPEPGLPFGRRFERRRPRVPQRGPHGAPRRTYARRASLVSRAGERP
jgi:hypothetical protein